MIKSREKNGFIFIETIIAIIILMTSLLLLFNMYFKLYNKAKEQKREDNVSSLYKSFYMKRVMEDYIDNFDQFSNLVNDNKLITNIGVNSSNVDISYIEDYLINQNNLDINNIYLIGDISKYKENCLTDFNNSKCNYIYLNLSGTRYINKIESENPILLFEFLVDDQENICKSNADMCHYEYVYLEL